VNTMDARGVLADALRRGRYRAKKSGRSLAFRCPRHDDSNASAWLGEHQWGCSACGFTEHFDTLATELGVTLPEAGARRGLTTVEYAERKGLALATLEKAGVHDTVGKYGDTLVAIPYRNATGETIRTKLRGVKGSWWAPDGEGTPLYGQDVLAAYPDAPVLLVEGESDCHAGWQRGLCVVGVPGASNFREEHAALLTGRHVVVWQEPDEGGATLVAKVAAFFPKARVLSGVAVQGQPTKDLCDLHQLVQGLALDWAVVWRDVLAGALPIGGAPPAVAFDAIAGMTLEQMLDEKLRPIDAIPTMLAPWNNACGGGGGGIGLARSWLVTIGALTGTGKSLIALNLAAEAIRHGETVVFISLEMGRSELGTRLLSIVSGVPVANLEQGHRFNKERYVEAALHMDRIQRETGGQVVVNRRPISKLEDVLSVIRHYAETQQARYFIVDYIQLVRTHADHGINERVEEVMHGLREATLEYQAITVALAQFNRLTSFNRRERPVAQGLAGSSAIENDSHQVLLFDHSRWTEFDGGADTWLLLDKNRHGRATEIPVRWDFTTLRLSTRTPTLEEQEARHGALTKVGRLR
jgi:hypothetical protein